MSEKSFSLSVKVLIGDGAGRYLVIRRSSKSKANAGRWDLPGGKVDAGESFAQGLHREVLEETGLTISLLRVAGAAQSELPKRIVAYLILEGRLGSGTVRLSDEHDECAWVDKARLLDVDFVPQFRSFIASFVQAD